MLHCFSLLFTINREELYKNWGRIILKNVWISQRIRQKFRNYLSVMMVELRIWNAASSFERSNHESIHHFRRKNEFIDYDKKMCFLINDERHHQQFEHFHHWHQWLGVIIVGNRIYQYELKWPSRHYIIHPFVHSDNKFNNHWGL